MLHQLIMDSVSTEAIIRRKKSKLDLEDDDDQESAKGMENLPHEIVILILSRLPVSSLIQFKYVCKAWRSLNLHDSIPDENYLCLIFHCDYPIRNQLYFVDFASYNDQNLPVKKIHTPFSSLMSEFDVVGSCNGLLCLSDSLYFDSVFIYNPFNRNYKKLPETIKYANQDVVFGFGCHPTTKEFKVVKIFYYRNGYKGGIPRFRRYTYQQSDALIFTLGSSDWRSIGKVAYNFVQGPSQVLVNGRLHWVTWPRRHRAGRSMISFDLADEQFREVPKPDCGGLSRCNYHLVVLKGCLSAAVYCNYGKLDIWVMKEYGVKESWSKNFNIGAYIPKGLKKDADLSFRISKIALKGRFVRVIGLFKNNEILLEYRSRALVLFDPKSRKFKDVCFRGMPNWFQTVVHVGSLTPIDACL